MNKLQSLKFIYVAHKLNLRTAYGLSVVSLITIFFQIQVLAQYPESDFQAKAQEIINQTADRYRPPSMNIGDPEKYYWPKTIARFEKYGVTDSIGNVWITAMKDNSPFHFTLLGMARLLHLYPHAPAIKAHRFTILQKVFERTDNYNAWTSEGTENHTSMSRTSGYLFAQEALHYPDAFPDAPKRLKQMKEWVLDWSSKALNCGTGEWNSSTYTAYNLCGFLNLYDFAKDEEVQQIAKKVLDYYAVEMALHFSFGIIGGAEMRGGGAAAGDFSATRYIAWLWLGKEEKTPKMKGSQYIQALHAVTSTYRPDVSFIDLALKNTENPLWLNGSKPSYLFEECHFVKQFFYRTNSFTLGSAISPYGGWTGGNYQLVNWKLVAKSNVSEPLQISGNGLTFNEYSGKARDPFSQYFQHKNTFVLVHKPPKNSKVYIDEAKAITSGWSELWLKDFTTRFPQNDRHTIVNFNKNVLAKNAVFINLSPSAKVELQGAVAFVELPFTYLAVTFLGKANQVSTLKKKIKKTERKILQIEAKQGQACGYVVEAFDKTEFDTWEKFKKTYQSTNRVQLGNFAKTGRLSFINLKGDKIEFAHNLDGKSFEALVDWGFDQKEPMVTLTSPPFQQPEWPKGKGWGRIPTVSVNGKAVDFSAPAPIYEGNGILVNDGEIHLEKR